MPAIEVNDTALHYRFDGPDSGPVVMLAHSLASDLAMWDLQVPPLTAAGFRVLRYDVRGHGRSHVPPGPYTMAGLAADAVALMDALELERVHFCGLSMGGMVGQALGAHHGRRLASLVLCATAAHVGQPDLWNERIATVRRDGMAAVADATIDRWFTPAGQARLAPAVEIVRRAVLTTPVEGFCACCAAIRDMDLREAIRAVTIPTLVIVGEQDQGTPVAAAEVIHAAIAGATLHIVPEAAHFVQMEQADTVNRALLSFLERRPAARHPAT